MAQQAFDNWEMTRTKRQNPGSWGSSDYKIDQFWLARMKLLESHYVTVIRYWLYSTAQDARYTRIAIYSRTTSLGREYIGDLETATTLLEAYSISSQRSHAPFWQTREQRVLKGFLDHSVDGWYNVEFIDLPNPDPKSKKDPDVICISTAAGDPYQGPWSSKFYSFAYPKDPKKAVHGYLKYLPESVKNPPKRLLPLPGFSPGGKVMNGRVEEPNPLRRETNSQTHREPRAHPALPSRSQDGSSASSNSIKRRGR
ncbi:hypothetical protein QBC35DRAFT_298260 [Podospora australis]|uniref:Uncharacterized protein n=1 Tax=Podospora australis TaxID=1536484 RepID=A0AAN7AFU8_9PEZI|nr:hypothetical protein QBC35DRAFT_298260 [Podospora australis]